MREGSDWTHNACSKRGAPADRTRAAQLFKRAADAGYVNGINALSLCYARYLIIVCPSNLSALTDKSSRRGHGVELDEELCFTLLKIAAETGYFVSQYNLGNCYRYALEDVLCAYVLTEIAVWGGAHQRMNGRQWIYTYKL